MPLERDPVKALRAVTIRNKRGLHARAAAKFVKMVEHFKANVTVMKDGNTVSGSSIMGLLMLSASMDTEIEICVTGKEAEHVLASLVALIERRFDEEQAAAS